MAYITRSLARKGCLVHRALSTSTVRHGGASVPYSKDEAYPMLGNRDIVGPGENNSVSYSDRYDYPFPAVRFQENTDEVMALREKEKGDWKNLTIEEKKALYRASFRQTFSEMHAPTGEWKSIAAIILFGLSVSAWFMLFMRTQVYPPLPSTVNDEWAKKSVQKMVTQGQGRIQGVSSMYDYEKNEWKK